MVPLSVLQTHDVIQILNTKPISAFVHRDLLETSVNQVNECNKFGIAYHIILLSLPSSVFKESFFEELYSIFKLMNTPDQSRVGEGIYNTQRINLYTGIRRFSSRSSSFFPFNAIGHYQDKFEFLPLDTHILKATVHVFFKHL